MELRTLRENAGLSIANVAKKTSRKATTIAKYETYHRLPSMEVLIQLADLYNVDYNTIICTYKAHKQTMERMQRTRGAYGRS